MRRGGDVQRLQVVAALQQADHAAAAIAVRDTAQLRGQPGEIRLPHPKLRQRVARMRVEPRRDEDEPGIDAGTRRRRRDVRAAAVFLESYRELPRLAWAREVIDSVEASTSPPARLSM